MMPAGPVKPGKALVSRPGPFCCRCRSFAWKCRGFRRANHDWLGLRADHERVAVLLEAASGWDQSTNDDVFFQTEKIVFPSVDCRLSQHAGGLLEGSRRDEAVGRQC